MMDVPEPDYVTESEDQAEVNKRIEAIRVLKGEIDFMLKDQNAKIVSNYNGQPHGRSKPKMTGEVRRITSVYLSEYMGPKISIFLEGTRLGLGFNEIELQAR